MAKAKETVITVSTVFAGTQSDRQAFIDLIRQRRELQKTKSPVDVKGVTGYTKITPNSGIRSGMENQDEDERRVC